MNCVIRDSREDDMVQVHSIYSHHVLHGTASFEEEPPSVEELTAAPRRCSWLAACLISSPRWTGQVVGYSYAHPYRSRPAYRFTLENSVYVDHRLSRRGIGRGAALPADCSL